MSAPAAERFWRFVERGAADECWNWVGGTSAGYGRFWYDGDMGAAHRYSWELARGPIPAGLFIDHLCRNPRCVNPNHLEPVTHTENVKRGDAARPRIAKPHCVHGHALEGRNLISRRHLDDGYVHRSCRTCAQGHMRKYQATDSYRAQNRDRKAQWRRDHLDEARRRERDAKRRQRTARVAAQCQPSMAIGKPS